MSRTMPFCRLTVIDGFQIGTNIGFQFGMHRYQCADHLPAPVRQEAETMNPFTMTGLELLQAMHDGHLPKATISETIPMRGVALEPAGVGYGTCTCIIKRIPA